MRAAQFLAIIGRGSKGSNALENTEDRAGATSEQQDNVINTVNSLDPYGPSWQLVPGNVAAGTVYAQVPTSGTGDLAFTRASTATRTDASGNIVNVASGVGRIDYRNANGSLSSTGRLLLEPQRTNLVFPSDVATTQTKTVTATAHTLSFYGTGSVTLSGVATGTLIGTGANNRVALTFTPTAGSLVLTVSGTVTNWQLEAGAFSSTLIQTTTATVTRLADGALKTGISSLIGQTEGVFYTELQIGQITSRPIFGIDIGTTSNYIAATTSATNQVRFIINQTSSATTLFTTSALTLGRHKLAFAYKSGDYVLYIDGVQAGVSAATTYPVGTLSQIVISSPNYGQLGDGYAEAALFTRRLTNAELAAITTL
jgi:hypothetical protein